MNTIIEKKLENQRLNQRKKEIRISIKKDKKETRKMELEILKKKMEKIENIKKID